MKPKTVNLANSGILIFLAIIIISSASISTFGKLDISAATLIVAAVTALTVAVLIAAAAYNGTRYLDRSRRGPSN